MLLHYFLRSTICPVAHLATIVIQSKILSIATVSPWITDVAVPPSEKFFFGSWMVWRLCLQLVDIICSPCFIGIVFKLIGKSNLTFGVLCTPNLLTITWIDIKQQNNDHNLCQITILTIWIRQSNKKQDVLKNTKQRPVISVGWWFRREYGNLTPYAFKIYIHHMKWNIK